MVVNIKRTSDKAIMPTYGTAEAAGMDLYVCIDAPVAVKPHETILLGTGVCMEIPKGYVGLVYARSGTATKRGLAPANKVGVIDSDYRGEIKVAMHNHSDVERVIEPYERVAQLVITPYVMADLREVDDLNGTERGAGGFGSTGKK